MTLFEARLEKPPAKLGRDLCQNTRRDGRIRTSDQPVNSRWKFAAEIVRRSRRPAIEVPDRGHLTTKTCLGRKMFPFGYIFLTFNHLQQNIPAREQSANMHNDESTVDHGSVETASSFGLMVRSRRKALNMRQDQLALVAGVGRKFVIDLEAGKPSCQLGRSLLVAEALGLKLTDILASAGPLSATASELPDLPEEVEEPDGQSTRIL